MDIPFQGSPFNPLHPLLPGTLPTSETFFIVVSWQMAGGAAATWWVEAGDAAEQPSVLRTAPEGRIIQPQLSAASRLEKLPGAL